MRSDAMGEGGLWMGGRLVDNDFLLLEKLSHVTSIAWARQSIITIAPSITTSISAAATTSSDWSRSQRRHRSWSIWMHICWCSIFFHVAQTTPIDLSKAWKDIQARLQVHGVALWVSTNSTQETNWKCFSKEKRWCVSIFRLRNWKGSVLTQCGCPWPQFVRLSSSFSKEVGRKFSHRCCIGLSMGGMVYRLSEWPFVTEGEITASLPNFQILWVMGTVWS